MICQHYVEGLILLLASRQVIIVLVKFGVTALYVSEAYTFKQRKCTTGDMAFSTIRIVQMDCEGLALWNTNLAAVFQYTRIHSLVENDPNRLKYFQLVQGTSAIYLRCNNVINIRQ